jgi:hypothetical protein
VRFEVWIPASRARRNHRRGFLWAGIRVETERQCGSRRRRAPASGVPAH